MKIFEVVSRYIDNRQDQFQLRELEADRIPENTFAHLKTRDVYHDYFTDRQDAERFIIDSKNGLI